nr:hypothetical protein [Tanacetum cinerariifolium]
MADNHTMAQMLQAPIEGYEDAIVVPQINANNFELKQTLINLVQSNQITPGMESDKVTESNAKNLLPIPNECEIALEDKRECDMPDDDFKDVEYVEASIVDPEIVSVEEENVVQQEEKEVDFEDISQIQDVVLQLHQLDTFYNALNPNDQDALDSAAGGNFLDKIPCECLSIIESKSKVRYSRSRVTKVRANANALPLSSSHSNSFDLQQIAASLEDKLDIRMN